MRNQTVRIFRKKFSSSSHRYRFLLLFVLVRVQARFLVLSFLFLSTNNRFRKCLFRGGRRRAKQKRRTTFPSLLLFLLLLLLLLLYTRSCIGLVRFFLLSLFFSPRFFVYIDEDFIVFLVGMIWPSVDDARWRGHFSPSFTMRSRVLFYVRRDTRVTAANYRSPMCVQNKYRRMSILKENEPLNFWSGWFCSLLLLRRRRRCMFNTIMRCPFFSIVLYTSSRTEHVHTDTKKHSRKLIVDELWSKKTRSSKERNPVSNRICSWNLQSWRHWKGICRR